MIVRIMGEGQFNIDDSQLDGLNELDDALSDAIDADDDKAFREALVTLLDKVRSIGTAVPNEELVNSELVLPHADAHVDEVRKLMASDGLIPG